jgi:hypothetical protein
MAKDYGESAAAINRRGDDASWPLVLKELKGGATLKRVPSIKRSYADNGHGPFGPGLSDARIRKLEKAGTIRFVGVDRYALTEAGMAT